MSTSQTMRKVYFAKEIAANDSIKDVFVLTQAQQFQAKNGPFWRLTLQDASGNIEGKVWSPLAQEIKDFTLNSFYIVTAKSTVYKDKVELSVSAIEHLSPSDEALLSLSDFIAVSPFAPDTMLAELKGLCARYITHPPLARFFELLFADDDFITKFKLTPAAKVMHHAYAGGLLEHTLSICRLCMSIADNYPYIDRQILLAGAICHDLGKIWELKGGVGIDYTDEGRLVGHIFLGIEKLLPYLTEARLEQEHIIHLQHLILSHHGTYEFGAARLPSTAEAFVLHFADNIDAKLQQVSQALGDAPESSLPWSGFIRGLDRAVYEAPKVGQLLYDTPGKVLNDPASGSHLSDAEGVTTGSFEQNNELTSQPVRDVALEEDSYGELSHPSGELFFAGAESFTEDLVFDEAYMEAVAGDEELFASLDSDSKFLSNGDMTEDAGAFEPEKDDLPFSRELPPDCLNAVATIEVMDEILPVSATKPYGLTRDRSEQLGRSDTIGPVDCEEDSSRNPPDMDGTDKKKKNESSQNKQSTLPLLEQCSLLSKG